MRTTTSTRFPLRSSAACLNVCRLAALGIMALLSGCGGGSASIAPSGSIVYTTLNFPNAAPGGSTFLTGVRAVRNSSDIYYSGIYTPAGGQMTGLIYQGPTTGGGTWNNVNFPSSPGAAVTSTALYGPDDDGSGNVTVVGNYTTTQQGDQPIGLLYQGLPDGSGTWSTLTPPGSVGTIAHSNMNGIVVGNYETTVGGPGKAFIYDIANHSFSELSKPGAASITAYGIWFNGGTSYTIAGGFTTADGGAAYLVDWDSSTRAASNWTSYKDPLGKHDSSLLTHFEGITGATDGYNLASDTVAADGSQTVSASFAHVSRSASGTFSNATWTEIVFPGSTLTSANTVFEKTVEGIYQLGSGVSNGYVASLP